MWAGVIAAAAPSLILGADKLMVDRIVAETFVSHEINEHGVLQIHTEASKP